MLSNLDNQSAQPSSVSSAPFISDLTPIMAGLSPAFRETTTGEIHLSRDFNGELSQHHSFFHLPAHWISKSAPCGEAMTLIPTVEAGYWRSIGFIPITKRIQLPLDS